MLISKKYGSCYTLDGQINSIIDCVFVETYFSRTENQNVYNRIVPDNTVELIITDKLFNRTLSGQNNTHVLRSHLSGLKTTWQDISLEGSPLISIRFKPEKIFHFTQIPASELKNQCLSPEDIFGNLFKSFEDEIFSQKNTENRLAIITDFFLKNFTKLKVVDDDTLFEFSKSTIERSNGNVCLKKLCSELKVSQKTLENKFKYFLGITPKEYCRLNRFISSVRRFTNSKMNLTELAYQSNFFDQSHLIKEYYNYTGRTPKAFFSSSLGIQEDIF